MIRKLANYIIRPQRVIYDDSDLGEKQFMHNYTIIHREDFDLKNKRDQTIKCSLFRQKSYEFGSQQNCVIFCHGNSGNRTAIFECLNFILDRGFLAVCFDFTGCGNSDGDHITLGYKESQDLQTVVDYVKSLGYVNNFLYVGLLKNYLNFKLEEYRSSASGNSSKFLWLAIKIKIAIWGRSMGAATTLLYVKENPNAVDAICLDSPFANLKILIYEFIQKFKVFADIFGDILYQKVRTQIEQDWNVNIDNVNPIECTQNVRIPAIFLHALHDSIVNKDHSDKIVKMYKGRKKYYNFSGGHNDIRNDQLYNEVMNFFEEIFGKYQTSITSCQNLEDQRLDNTQSFNPINFSSTSFGGDCDRKSDLLTEFQKDRHYVNRQSKRSKIFFKTENLINKDNDNDVINRSFVKIRDLNIQRRMSKKKTTILLKNFVEMTEESDLDDDENLDAKTQYGKILSSNGNIKIDFQMQDDHNLPNLPLRSKSNSILKSSTMEIILDSEGRERAVSPNKQVQLSGRKLHSQSQEFEVDDNEFDCEDNQKHMPNTNDCFSFKKYSIYKHVSSHNNDHVEKTTF